MTWTGWCGELSERITKSALKSEETKRNDEKKRDDFLGDSIHAETEIRCDRDDDDDDDGDDCDDVESSESKME